jgi:hypothetical protein
MLGCSITLWQVKRPIIFLGRVYGAPRHSQEWLSLTGRGVRVLTIDNLRKRNLIVINRCCLCKSDGETIDHLLHCEIACSLWYAVVWKVVPLCIV